MKNNQNYSPKHKVLLISAFCLICGIYPKSAIAYPQVEMQSCIASAVNATMVKGLDVKMWQIEGYCDCSLKKVIDEGKDVRSSLIYCNAKYLY